MALIKCKECGKEISDKAKQCVHCGYNNSEINSSLKSGNGVAVAIVVLGIMAGCILFLTGIDLTQLESVSGNSVAESYYQHIGFALIGISLYIIMITIYMYNKVKGSKEIKWL